MERGTPQDLRSARVAARVAALALVAAAALALLLTAASPARAYSGQIQWAYWWSLPGDVADEFISVAPAPGGDLYVTGIAGGTPTAGDLLMQRLKPVETNGTPLVWSQSYDNPVWQGADRGSLLVTGRRGNVTAVGTTTGRNGATDWILVSRSSSGAYRWSASYDGHGLADIPTAATRDTAGNVYVAGYSVAVASQTYDIVVRKFAAGDGHPIWTWIYRGPTKPQKLNVANGLAVDATGHAYVTGSSRDPSGIEHPILAKLTAKGRTAWVRYLKDPTGSSQIGEQVGLSNGAVYLTTTRGGASGTSILGVSRYTPAGKRVWLRTWSGPADSVAIRSFDLTFDGAGNLICGGYIQKPAFEVQAWVGSWTPAGKRRWATTYWEGDQGSRFTSVWALTADGAGNVWAAGTTKPAANQIDALAIRLSPRGKIAWVRNYDAGFGRIDDYNDVALWGKNAVVMVGRSDMGASNYDAIAVKYQR
jgi:hypothetical protein